MAAPATPRNFYLQTGNGQAYLSWDLAAGATSYSVQRSTDGVTYSVLTSPTPNNYLDTTVTIGTLYYYKVAATNSDGTSAYTSAQSCVACPSGEMSLGELRQRAQQRADRLNSNFVTVPEWNAFINLAMFELYDLLVTSYEDYNLYGPVFFSTVAGQNLYALPTGSNAFTTAAGDAVTPPAFYKLRGVDLGINPAGNAYATVSRFNFNDRNKYVYPNNPGPLYGMLNLRYRVQGTNLMFIPPPAAGQQIGLWFIPRLTQLLADNNVTDIGISGWLDYVIVRAAKYALDKEESDTSMLNQELTFLKTRIEEASQNRDANEPATICDVASNGGGSGSFGPGFNGPIGGW